MNEIYDKDKFMLEILLKQLGFTYIACGPFTKSKERIEKFMQAGNTDFIYKNDLDKVCFQHNMAYGKLKDLPKRTESEKVLRDKAHRSCTLYIALLSIIFRINFGTGTYFVYYKYINRDKETGAKESSNYQGTCNY